MPRFPFLTLLLPLLWQAGGAAVEADPISITSGSIVATNTEFRFTIPGPGPLVTDLFHSPGVYHTPLSLETTLIGGLSWNSGTFMQGTFELNGVSYALPIGYEWMTAIQPTHITPGQPVTGVPFQISGSFSQPEFGTVEFSGGGFESIDANRTVFAFVANPPQVTVTPEPGSFVLLASGLVAFALAVLRSRRGPLGRGITPVHQ